MLVYNIQFDRFFRVSGTRGGDLNSTTIAHKQKFSFISSKRPVNWMGKHRSNMKCGKFWQNLMFQMSLCAGLKCMATIVRTALVQSLNTTVNSWPVLTEHIQVPDDTLYQTGQYGWRRETNQLLCWLCSLLLTMIK